MSTKKATLLYITKVAHDNGVNITDDAKALYKALPSQEAVKDMLTHAAQLTKAMGRKTISTELAQVEMNHYNKK